MTLPETTPPPVLGYAGAEAIQLDLRALARIRLGNWFLIAYMASSPVRGILLPRTAIAVQALVTACFAFCLVAAAYLLSANTRLPSDRAVFRRLLVATAIALAIESTICTFAMYVTRGKYMSGTPTLRVLTTILPFSTIAYGSVLCLCFLRLADLARRFQARAIALQCLVVAVAFLAIYAFYLTYGLLISYIGPGLFSTLTSALAIFRSAISLWAAIFLACLLPRLKSTPV